MAHDVLINSEKYMIQIIVNPGTYWITKFESAKWYKTEMEIFKYLLGNHVIKLTNSEVSNEMLVAVEQNGEFCRGLVTDIFHRSSKNVYSVLLVDYGKIIETTKDKIYLIQNKNLKERKFKAVQISVHGIQPAGLDIDDKNVFKSIFQRRKCNSWSPNAYKFVENLFRKNSQVFVEIISSNKNCLSGNIYFIQDFDKTPVSLGQKLCDEGFAVLCSFDLPKFISEDNPQNDRDFGIEKKIPQNALFQAVDEFETLEHFTDSSNTESAAIERVISKPNILVKTNTNYSSSWILKKCLLNSMTTPSNNIFKQKDISKVEKNNNTSRNSEISLLRVAMKSMKYFDRHKKIQQIS